MLNPLVTIVIPVYNGADYIREAIDSALEQTYENLEILVINDGSNDSGETEHIALSYGNRIRYFYKENGGVATALNLGIREMRGEYFSWLSHDDMYFPNKIKAQIQLLSESGDTTRMVCSSWAVIDSTGKEIHRVLPSQKYSLHQLTSPLFALFHGQINSCSLLIHKAHFERVGVFSETLPTTQDFDLWFRIMRNNELAYHPDVLSMTRVHSNQGSKTCKTHSAESDILWIKMMETLTLQEKIDLDGSVYKFYKNVYRMLHTFSSNHQAVNYAWRCAREELKKVSSVPVYLLKSLTLFLSGYVVFGKLFFTSMYEVGIVNTFKRVIIAIRRLRYLIIP
jgi:glycosyltransferase involved in cell wall biosynthesis